MGAERELEKRIKRKQQEIIDLERQLYEARAYHEAMEESLKLMSKYANANGDDGLRPGSMVDKARNIIRQAGEPLHVDRILEGMGKEKTKKNKLSLAGSLASYVRKGLIFARPAPNTFGLKELGEVDKSDLPPDEPPNGFGFDG